MTLRLILGSDVLDFDQWDVHGIIVSSVDLGFPTVREVMTDLPGQDGEFDETAYLGTRVVTLTGNIGRSGITGDSRSQGLAALAPFVAPMARPQLLFALDDDVYERTLTLRIADWSGPVAGGDSINFSASFKCPDPIAYGTVINEVDLAPVQAVSDPGRHYPLTFPRSYPAGFGGGGRTVVTTAGNYPSWPVLRIYGPCTDPRIEWLDPVSFNPLGPAVVFAGLAIAEGEYIEVDVKAQSVLLNGDPTANRYSFVDFGNTSWAPLQPGDNILIFEAAAASAPSTTAVRWQDAFLL